MHHTRLHDTGLHNSRLCGAQLRCAVVRLQFPRKGPVQDRVAARNALQASTAAGPAVLHDAWLHDLHQFLRNARLCVARLRLCVRRRSLRNSRTLSSTDGPFHGLLRPGDGLVRNACVLRRSTVQKLLGQLLLRAASLVGRRHARSPCLCSGAPLRRTELRLHEPRLHNLLLHDAWLHDAWLHDTWLHDARLCHGAERHAEKSVPGRR